MKLDELFTLCRAESSLVLMKEAEAIKVECESSGLGAVQFCQLHGVMMGSLVETFPPTPMVQWKMAIQSIHLWGRVQASPLNQGYWRVFIFVRF